MPKLRRIAGAREKATSDLWRVTDSGASAPSFSWHRQRLHLDIKNGEGGIRTPEPLRAAGFQDRCNRPLCHLSKMSQPDELCQNRASPERAWLYTDCPRFWAAHIERRGGPFSAVDRTTIKDISRRSPVRHGASNIISTATGRLPAATSKLVRCGRGRVPSLFLRGDRRRRSGSPRRSDAPAVRRAPGETDRSVSR